MFVSPAKPNHFDATIGGVRCELGGRGGMADGESDILANDMLPEQGKRGVIGKTDPVVVGDYDRFRNCGKQSGFGLNNRQRRGCLRRLYFFHEQQNGHCAETRRDDGERFRTTVPALIHAQRQGRDEQQRDQDTGGARIGHANGLAGLCDGGKSD